MLNQSLYLVFHRDNVWYLLGRSSLHPSGIYLSIHQIYDVIFISQVCAHIVQAIRKETIHVKEEWDSRHTHKENAVDADKYATLSLSFNLNFTTHCLPFFTVINFNNFCKILQ